MSNAVADVLSVGHFRLIGHIPADEYGCGSAVVNGVEYVLLGNGVKAFFAVVAEAGDDGSGFKVVVARQR